MELLSDIRLDTWINLLGTLISAGLAAFVAYIIVSKQNNAQTSLLISQVKYERERDAHNFIVQMKLEKYSLIMSSLVDSMRCYKESYQNIMNYIRSDDSYTPAISLDDLRRKEDELQKNLLDLQKEMNILLTYFPKIKAEWERVLTSYTEMSNIIYDGYTYPGRYQQLVNDTSETALKNSFYALTLDYVSMVEIIEREMQDLMESLEKQAAL
ncbi:hypothetical protein HCA69_01995 [Listeria grandensis]|uniref:Uncharacterized protein n=1 Tax=Listeria grandensis TaxID=1494963 RepID=A0A7X0Y163_9LIST|nr:hypothetical protein [Listeria grandensis]MBC1935120.1 hypothetical protein [Listeria grandensis]